MKMTRKSLCIASACAAALAACGGTDRVPPDAPTSVSAAPGSAPGTAVVSFTAPAMTGSSAITGYTVSASPGGATTTGTASPITLTGLSPKTAYTYSVFATNGQGSSAAASTNALRFYSVVETFHEPMTQPNDTIFTGTFTWDATSKTVSNLAGALTESMTKVNGAYGPPMTTVALSHQLSSTAATLGGAAGLLVTTFALDTVNTFDPSGFAPGGTQFYGLAAGAANPKSGGTGTAYAMIFINTTDPATAAAKAQLDMLAYADCTAGGMMMTSCMTGTAMAGYGKMGTMMGEPMSQTITER
jgi:hypothetical protein